MPQYLVTLPDDNTDPVEEADELQDLIQNEFCGTATVKPYTDDTPNALHPDSRP